MISWISPLVNSHSQLRIGLTRGRGLHQLHATKETVTPNEMREMHTMHLWRNDLTSYVHIAEFLTLPFQHSRTHARGTIWRRATKFWLSHLCRFLFHMGPVQSKICMKVKLRHCTILVQSKFVWLCFEWRIAADKTAPKLLKITVWRGR